jgi:hypothetical protein
MVKSRQQIDFTGEVLTKDYMYSQNSTMLLTNENKVLHLLAGYHIVAATAFVLKNEVSN